MFAGEAPVSESISESTISSSDETDVWVEAGEETEDGEVLGVQEVAGGCGVGVIILEAMESRGVEEEVSLA